MRSAEDHPKKNKETFALFATFAVEISGSSLFKLGLSALRQKEGHVDRAFVAGRERIGVAAALGNHVMRIDRDLPAMLFEVDREVQCL